MNTDSNDRLWDICILQPFLKQERIMRTEGKIQTRLRLMKLRFILGGGEPSAEQVRRAVKEIIRYARRDETAGVRKDRVLFSFESLFEEISDEIYGLRERGEREAYRDIYRELYEFAAEAMADTYMPLYLFILYRYACAVLEEGKAREAMELFQKLYEGTDRLIGIFNPYAIGCLERYAAAAVQAGEKEKAQEAIRKMYAIAAREFGMHSAVMRAVSRLNDILTENAFVRSE